ncbi:HSPB1-associated protein 1 isoform X1 [Maniola jurtina]|uniref:HSPB1-associated protein 1 isoform X1 n=1 Tax=Maniola jurtina TaxID=191418 RepID=UPI001E68CF91|nr:HSPB1-associated protein 1 isoform X1 [Maniola jurtina]
MEVTDDVIRNLSTKASLPLVFRQFVKDWPICAWDENKWTSVFGEKEIPFRCLNKSFVSDEPCWERRCQVKKMTFNTFLGVLNTSQDWMYFDYKYLHQWFSSDSELCKTISWKQFGYPDKGPADTTLWVGSQGSHTPAHQDTYGYNIVAQVYGRKRWILFPPEAGGLKPTRVPYEESSVYSELNFYCPNDLEAFNGLTGGRWVELRAGDALLVPRGWWHYVQNLDPLNIALNVWLPHEKDNSMQISEALIKILIAQICKDLPQETARLLVNPNEDDISDTPLAVLFLQLETVVKTYLDKKRKTRRVKRQKTREDNSTEPDIEEFDIKSLLDNHKNKLEIVPTIASSDIVDLIKGNIREFVNNKVQDEDEVEAGTSSLCLTKAVIDSFSQTDVINLVKQNLFARLG